MVTPNQNMNGSPPSERTPLLHPSSPHPNSRSHDDAVIDDADIRAAEEVGEGALEAPTFPELGKRRSYSHSHWLAPDEDANAREEPEFKARFQENGLLEGLSKWKFRCIFGGILLGYFVSILQSFHICAAFHYCANVFVFLNLLC